MRRLTTGIRSEKYVVRRFRRCANVIECTYTNLDSIAYYTLSLVLGYKHVQRVTVPNTVGSCNTMVLQYYNIILWDHLPIYGSLLTETSLCGAYLYCLFGMYRSSVQNTYRTAFSITWLLHQLHISYRYRHAYTWTDIGRLRINNNQK